MADVELTGDFLEIYLVTSVGETGESETLIAKTLDTVSISPDVTSAEAKLHNSEQKTRKNVGFDHNLEFSGLMMSSLDALTQLGILTADTPPQLRGFPAGGVEAIRIKVYENKGDGTAAQEWLCNTVELAASGLEWPQEDFGTWACEGMINGTVQGETLQS